MLLCKLLSLGFDLLKLSNKPSSLQSLYLFNISKGSRKSLSINLKTYSPSLDVDGKYISLDGE